MIEKDNKGYILYHEMDSVYSVYLDTTKPPSERWCNPARSTFTTFDSREGTFS